MTREEQLLKALDASIEREREMHDRLLEMERRMDGWKPEDDNPPPLVEQLEKMGVPIDALHPLKVSVERSVGSWTRVTIEAANRREFRAAYERAADAFRRLAITVQPIHLPEEATDEHSEDR